MVTAIVRRVQALLREAGRPDVAVEIVFPVASEAITPTGSGAASRMPGSSSSGALGDLAIVPGPAGGEGCSAEGGCASCPFMKVGCSLFPHLLSATAHDCNTMLEQVLSSLCASLPCSPTFCFCHIACWMLWLLRHVLVTLLRR